MDVDWVDAAVAKAYGGKRKIHWMEVYAGEKSTKIYGPDVWLPEETVAAVQAIVAEIGAELGRTVGPGDMGKVMGVVKTRLAGKADMGQVSGAVKTALAG